MRFKFQPFVHQLAALAVAAGALVWHREAMRKLADMTMILADAPGFAEAAAAHPLGCLEWCFRYLTATGLTAWGIPLLLALVALAQGIGARATRRSPAAAWLPVALVTVPLFALGPHLWTLWAPFFLHAFLFWYVVAAATLALFGRRGAWAWAALPLALVALGRLCWGDLPWHESLRFVFPIVPGPGAAVVGWTFGLALAALFLLEYVALIYDADGSPRPRNILYHLAPPAIVLVATFAAASPRGTSDQLKMERCAIAGDFDGLLKVAPKKARPERMETAWRLLALFRKDRLDRDLWRFPIIGSHRTTEEPEMDMNGPDLLFQYGLVLPARRWTYEAASARGWRPYDYRLLGDAAVVCGEMELARKNYRQLARCPFRGDFAVRRLAALSAPKIPDGAFADLANVAGIYGVWRTPGNVATVPYGDNDACAERIAYSLFLTLQNAPPPMLKMFFALSLLEGRPGALRENRAALGLMYPRGNIGPVFLEVLR